MYDISPSFHDTYRQLPRHMYLPAITSESARIIDNLAVAFVNVTIHWLPFIEHFIAPAIAYLPNGIKRVTHCFCQYPTWLFDLFEIAVRNRLDKRFFVENST